jgi:hypothetical protein
MKLNEKKFLFLSKKIEDTTLPSRIRQACHKNDIYTLFELLRELNKLDAGLWISIGKKGIDEIELFFKEEGINLFYDYNEEFENEFTIKDLIADAQNFSMS